MSPARTADSLWARLGHSVSDSAPVSRFNDSVLHHEWVGRTREFAGDLSTRLYEIFYPVILVCRGLRRAATGGRTWWAAGSKEKRRVQAAAALVVLVLIGLLPYGPVLLAVGFLCWAGWLGRDTTPKDADPEPGAHVGRLQAVYDGLVPYLHDEHDPDQHFKPGGGYRDAFTAWEFDEHDRLTALTFDYSQFVKDGEAECRAKVERAIEGKVGRGNEFLYDWDEEGNQLSVRVLPPLPAGLAAQPWPVAEIEYVLGITDPDSATRLIPVLMPEEPGSRPEPLPPHLAARASAPPEGWRTAVLAPVVWRVGNPCPNPHLLVTGSSGSGKTTLLRSLLGQALGRGQQVAVIDVEQTETYADLVGRPGVRGVVEDAEQALELLDWFGLECERRAERRRAEAEALANGETTSFPALKVRDASAEGLRRAQEAGADADDEAAPSEPTLWLCIDGLPELLDAANRLGRAHLEDTLAVLARKARYAGVLLLTTVREERLLQLSAPLRAQLTVRVAMGSVEPAVSTALFGGTLELGGSRRLAAGRGYVRVGKGPVIRLQAPYAPPMSVVPLREVGIDVKPATVASPAAATS